MPIFDVSKCFAKKVMIDVYFYYFVGEFGILK